MTETLELYPGVVRLSRGEGGAQVTRRTALRAGLAATVGALVGSPRHAWAQGRDDARIGVRRSLIVLWMDGGPSHIDTWDPKTGPVAGPHKSIKTSVPGLLISEHMPELARLAHKLAVVRGMTSKEGNHERARYLLHTGYAPTTTVQHPTMAEWMSKRFGEPHCGLPATVSIGPPRVPPGFFGVEHRPFIVDAPGRLPPNVGYGPGVNAARFEARMRVLESMEASFAERSGDSNVDGRRALYAKADRLMHAPALAAFDIGSEPRAIVSAFGDTYFGRGCLTAVRLVTAGVRAVHVMLEGWDTHDDNSERTKKLMRVLDPAMGALLTELDRRGVLERTVVLWAGEFGRTPRISRADGRDHHAAAWSAVLAGGGVRAGVVHGETDGEGARVVKDAVSVPDLLATVATLVGLDPADMAMSPAGRPVALADKGTPVAALIAPNGG